MRLTTRARRLRTALALTVVGVAVALAVDGGHDDVPPRSTVVSAAAAGVSVGGSPVTPRSVRGAADRLLPAPDLSTTPRAHPTGRLHVVAERSRRVGRGPLRRYRVAVEGGLLADPREFAADVRRTLGDRRGWGRHLSFRQVSGGAHAFTVVLASPRTTGRLCAPMRTHGVLSCFHDGRAVINAFRWRHGAASYGWSRHLSAYRHYVVLHEVGHALGHGHLYACRSDGRAPTMMQQTKSLYGCTRNPWPYP